MSRETMKKKELLEFAKGCKNVGALAGVKFAYAVTKNKKVIEPEVTALMEACRPPEKFITFEQLRIQLCEKHADRDENGNPVIVPLNGQKVYVGATQKKEFQDEFKKLTEEHKDAIDAYDKQMEEYEKLLEEEVTVEIYQIPLEEVPEAITQSQFEALNVMIKE